jgi:hypothetical protein
MFRVPFGIRRLAVLLTLALFSLPSTFAQETTAGLQGSVKDSSGALVANATVEITSPALIGSKKLQSDAAGGYRFAALPPGDYNITVTAAGFRTYRRIALPLSAGRLPTVDIILEVGTVAEVIEVSGTAENIDVTQSKVAVTVSQQVINNLPKGRSRRPLRTDAGRPLR